MAHGDLPAALAQIAGQIQARCAAASNLDELKPAWEMVVARARQLIPGARVEDEGEVLVLGDLSPGCQACKDGAWDCVFITNRCNLNCSFCLSPHAVPPDYCGSAFGDTLEEIRANHRKARLDGIAFSGGEPFTQPEKLFDWIRALTAQRPGVYRWVYTNGLLVTVQALEKLADLGVCEIRFNVAASGYDHPRVMAIMAQAARLIPHVTVEIPSIPEDAPRLLACLEKWSAAGVRYLNLHELMFEPGANAACLTGPRQKVITPDGHHTAVHPHSRLLTLEVMAFVQRMGLPLSVNDCSLQSKLRQVRGRRRLLAPLTRAPHERLTLQKGSHGEDVVFETIYVSRGEGENLFCHPDSLAEMRAMAPDARYFRLLRRAPLSLHDQGPWIELIEI